MGKLQRLFYEVFSFVNQIDNFFVNKIMHNFKTAGFYLFILINYLILERGWDKAILALGLRTILIAGAAAVLE